MNHQKTGMQRGSGWGISSNLFNRIALVILFDDLQHIIEMEKVSNIGYGGWQD